MGVNGNTIHQKAAPTHIQLITLGRRVIFLNSRVASMKIKPVIVNTKKRYPSASTVLNVLFRSSAIIAPFMLYQINIAGKYKNGSFVPGMIHG
jgi:hypothetical protein